MNFAYKAWKGLRFFGLCSLTVESEFFREKKKLPNVYIYFHNY